ncbi:dentin sialophosphoprotein-like [Macrosteles quadrilineatus]|uniref:dentin sialophosphoprotein-like n=1 Tax=Macrosteles quadrilineatus TaxID=74068 RepID=UPI0023E28C88|nr:dentin sialophosphoprotein-like [Macrosteles quadrilineatus]XP_054266617.1 dentin sialophosphoprotein-like [Macrosteles quadrilineatus]XP_054266619.1 dentin sialophosphoprotein-like [Macrosteles quadrilineatus]
MSYTFTDPESLNRDPDTSSLASTSTTATTASQQSTKKKKPWSKFKSSIKSIGDKMSSKPKFTDPTESSEQKRVKKGKKVKASSSGELKPSTPEEPPRAKSPTKNIMKKLSVESISTPFVGYQPASVSPGPKSYAKALHKSGSTSESNLSASDIDTPKKSLTLDRNIKLQESPDSGRASQTMGSLEGSRPPSQIKEVSSDVSVDSDYTSPSQSKSYRGLEEESLDKLVTKTEQFAQSLTSPGKESNSDVSVEFLKAETAVKPETKDSKEPAIGIVKEKNEAPVEKGRVGDEDAMDGRKKKNNRESKKEDSSGFINSERSVVDPIAPPSKTPRKGSDSKSESTDKDAKKGASKSKESQNDDSKGTPETTSTSDEKRYDNKPDKPPSKVPVFQENVPNPEKRTSSPTEGKIKNDTVKKEDPKPQTPKSDDAGKPALKTPEKVVSSSSQGQSPSTLTGGKSTSDTVKKEGPEPKTKKSDDVEKAALKTPQKDVSSPLTDPQGLTVEEKLQAFLSAEGMAGTIKETPAKNGDGSLQSDKRECLYKILVIGELGTGKTSIIKRYVHQFFSQHYRATIGVDFALKVLNWDSNTIIRLQLWDIAGQERFGNMTRVYYKEAVGAFIVFDVTRSATFDAVLKWKQDLDSKVQLADGSHIPCVLLANKCDQQKEGIVNTPAKMDEYCKENNFSAWFETSAKENINIDEAAKSLVTQILQNDKSSQNGRDSGRDGGKFPLDGKSEQESKSCAC